MRFSKKEIFNVLKEYGEEESTKNVYDVLLKEGKYWNNSTKKNAILSEFDKLNR